MVGFDSDFDFVVVVGSLIGMVFLFAREFFMLGDGADSFGEFGGGYGFGWIDIEAIGVLVVDPFGDVFFGGFGVEDDDGSGGGECGGGVVDIEDDDGFLCGEGVENAGAGEANHGLADLFFFRAFGGEFEFVCCWDDCWGFRGILSDSDDGCGDQSCV